MGLSSSTIDLRGEATVDCVSIVSITHTVALFLQLHVSKRSQQAQMSGVECASFVRYEGPGKKFVGLAARLA